MAKTSKYKSIGLLIFALLVALICARNSTASVQISFTFLSGYTEIPYGLLVIYSLLILSLFAVLSLTSFLLIWRLKFVGSLDRTINFIIIMLIKYMLPVVFVGTLQVDGRSIFNISPVYTVFLQSVFGISFLLDWTCFAFAWDESSEVTVKVGKIKIIVPAHQIIQFLTILLNSILSLGLFYLITKIDKEIQQQERNK